MKYKSKEDYDKKVSTAQKYHGLAREIRGRYLNSVAVLDTYLAEIITDYFCKKGQRKDLFFSEIATGQHLSLRNKKDILWKIMNIELKPYLKDYKDLNKKIDSILIFRNKLAHATIDVSEEALSVDKVIGVGFVEYKDGKRVVHYFTKEESEYKQAELNTLLGDIKGIKTLLFGRFDFD